MSHPEIIFRWDAFLLGVYRSVKTPDAPDFTDLTTDFITDVMVMRPKKKLG